MIRSAALRIVPVALSIGTLTACESGAPARPSSRLLERTRMDTAVQLAADNIATGKFDRARGALAGFPSGTNFELELTRARIDIEEGAYAPALERLDGVATAARDAAAWHALRGVALEGLGRWEEAVGNYERAYTLGPDATGLVAYSDALASSGRADEARVLLARERGRYPGDTALCLLAARLADRLGDRDAAANEYAAAALAKPDDLDIRLRLGDALLAAGRGGEAVGVWESLVTAALRDPVRMRVQRRLGESYLVVGRSADAQRTFRLIVGVNPDDSAARVALAAAYLAGGQAAEALQAASAVLARQPEQAQATLVAALAQRRLRQTPAAIALLTRLAERRDALPVVRELLAAWRSE